MNDIKNVCVYSASSTKIASIYFEIAEELGHLLARKGINKAAEIYGNTAYELGALLAQEGITVVTGAGSIGLMRMVEDGALENGGKVVGVIPQFMVEQGWHHQGLTHLVETETMHERKQLMAEMSDGVIALPGGCGTLEELLEIITWKQLGIYLKPIVILNVNGYFVGQLFGDRDGWKDNELINTFTIKEVKAYLDTIKYIVVDSNCEYEYKLEMSDI